MKRGWGILSMLRAVAIAAVAACTFGPSLPAAQAQTAEPLQPETFRAMDTPGAPKDLITAPAPSLITPATGVPNPPPGFTGNKMVMTQQVWSSYVSYLRNEAATGYGLFMITVDGTHHDVKQCENYACQISPVTRTTALGACQVKMHNRRCVVFAEGRDIKVAYQVVP